MHFFPVDFTERFGIKVSKYLEIGLTVEKHALIQTNLKDSNNYFYAKIIIKYTVGRKSPT